MALPANRVPVRVARGLKSALVANLGDLLEGELLYAKDEDKLYMVEGGALVAMGADLAASSVGDLSDVTLTSAADGEVLQYNGTAWVNAVLDADALADVDTSTTPPTTDQVLAWDGTNWVPSDVSAVGGGVTRIQDATDYEPNTTPPAGTIYYFPKAIANYPEDWTCPDQGTYSTDPGDGTFRYAARYDRDGRETQGVFPSSGSIWWTFDLTQPWTQMTYTAIGASSTCSANSKKAFNNVTNGWPLDGSTDKTLYLALTDLGTGTPIPLAVGDYLRYDGGDFRPKQLATVAETGAYSDLSGTPTLATVATTGAYSDLSGAPTLGTAAAAATTDFATAAQGTLADSAVQPTDSIDVLADVDTTTSAPTSGQVLQWNGTNWVPATQAPGGVTSIIAGTGISVDQATGDVTITATGGGGGGVSGIGVATRVSDSGTAASSALTLTGLGSSGMLHTLSTDLDAWVVFYGSAADRTADAGRAYNTDPAAGSGVLAEAYVTTAGAILFTPGTGYMNNDTTETAALYLAVRDQAGAAVNATLTVTAYVQGGYTGVSGGTFGSG